MKSDIDTLMQSANIDALLITGPGQHNPAMVYLTGTAYLTSAELIKRRGEPPVLFYNSMERDEAISTGLETRNLDDYQIIELINQYDGDLIKATAERYRLMFRELGITDDRVAVYGQRDAGEAFAVLSVLQDMMPEVTLVGEFGDSILLKAMATKDEDEVERIRCMGQITTTVVGQVADFLRSFQVKSEVLIKPDGNPLTVGDVKSRINLWLAEYGVDNIKGTIFAIGRDAGVPHNSGTSTDVLCLGQTIVFDIFPCEAGGGYHYDFTRTWCLGYAPDDTRELYENVLDVYRQIMSELRAGELCKVYQQHTCELFEAQGHTTIQSNPQTQEGYVHSLGHGLGLHVHERPSFRSIPSNEDRLDPGVVVTIEPGLYYPDRGLGVRLEDTIWVRPDGQPEILADYPLDLVLPMNY